MRIREILKSLRAGLITRDECERLLRESLDPSANEVTIPENMKSQIKIMERFNEQKTS